MRLFSLVKTIVLPAVFLVFIPPASHAQDANWLAARDALAVCARVYPDTSSAWPILSEMGWRNEGTEGGMRIFSINGYRAAVGINAGISRAPMCLVSASRMTPDYALSLAQEVLPRLKDAKRDDSAPRNLVARWSGTMQGQLTVLAVIKHIDLDLMRGAAVGFSQR